MNQVPQGKPTGEAHGRKAHARQHACAPCPRDPDRPRGLARTNRPCDHGAGHAGRTRPTPRTAHVAGLGLAVTTFTLTPLSLAGPGVCPEQVAPLPVLGKDFTGHYHLKAVCSTGTLNAGATFLEAAFDIVAGVPQSAGSFGTPCIVAGPGWSIDVMIDLGPVSVLGLPPIEPVGEVLLTVTQWAPLGGARVPRALASNDPPQCVNTVTTTGSAWFGVVRPWSPSSP